MSTPGERQAIEMGKGSPVDFEHPELTRNVLELLRMYADATARLAKAEARIAELEQERDAANRLMLEAAAFVREYVRVYPNNSGRAIRWLEGTGK